MVVRSQALFGLLTSAKKSKMSAQSPFYLRGFGTGRTRASENNLILRARCSSLGGLCLRTEQVKQIHAQLITNSLLGQPSVVAKLIERYRVVADGAHLIFQHHAGSSAVVSNAMVRYSRPRESLAVFSPSIRRVS
ncbi:hypothetical protein B296_00021747 [Ensete ventricosum]|uniref:Uncharacterized protein n=1 Tax=Ensete ventricosum TaxID=4639 RepID=A0A426YX62_ENSVE|nr:hypothetical protein B296_00021747 [Ensete ventricosum]